MGACINKYTHQDVNYCTCTVESITVLHKSSSTGTKEAADCVGTRMFTTAIVNQAFVNV